MNELLNLVEELKLELDNTKEIKELLKEKEKVLQDKELLSKIEKYNITKDTKLKEEILSNKLFNKYKDKEINLNILIMSINKELKKIKGDKNCNL